MRTKILFLVIIGFVFLSPNTYAQNNIYRKVEKVRKSNTVFKKIIPFQKTRCNTKILDK